MSAPRVLFRVVASSEVAGLVSLRVLAGGFEMPASYTKVALTNAGFRVGEIVALERADEDVTVVQ